MIIVTGGCGFIGSHVVHRLVARGEEVLVVDRDGCFDAIRDPVKAIIHLGAVTSTTETNAELILESNQLLSAKVWRYCRNNNVPLIYASSASVYGQGLRGFSEVLPLDMNDPLPLYADSKRWFDNYVLREASSPSQQHWNGRVHQFVDQTPPHWCGLRLFNVYGDGEEHKGEQASVVSKWIRAALADDPIEVFEGSDEFRRDFVFVDDVVSVILWALDNPPPNGIYNVGTGEATTFLAAADAVRDALNDLGHYVPTNPVSVPMPANLSHYQKRTKANIMKLRAAGYDKPLLDIFAGAAITAQRMANAD